MAGANVVMMASELMRHGVGRIGEVVSGIDDWLEIHDYDSIEQIRGIMSYRNVTEPSAFERANYMQMLHSWRGERRAVAG
jgi:dihydroorotate dehydrogenase (fumarate)